MIAGFVLTGMMGAGKSCVGKLLAGRVGLPFYDLDETIVESEGASIREIILGRGEDAFRRLESLHLRNLCDSASGILAVGGGTGLDPGNRALLNGWGPVFYLRAAPAVLAARLRRSGREERPLLIGSDPAEILREILKRRSSIYEEADWIIDTDDLSADEVAVAIEDRLSE